MVDIFDQSLRLGFFLGVSSSFHADENEVYVVLLGQFDHGGQERFVDLVGEIILVESSDGFVAG